MTNFLKLTSAGESHGKGYTGIIEGLPSGLKISLEEIQAEINRRKTGGQFASPRIEEDKIEILSGFVEGKTTGAPLAFFIANKNQQSKDYAVLKNYYRPGHADVVRDLKFSHSDHLGGGIFSARNTITAVVAGAFAKKILKKFEIEVLGYVSQIGSITYKFPGAKLDPTNIEKSVIRNPDPVVSRQMEDFLQQITTEQNSVGSKATIHVYNCPLGLGTPRTEKMNALLAECLFSIPAVMAVALGDGENAAAAYGDKFHDEIHSIQGQKVKFVSNNHGGILGGLTTGAPIVIHATLKPPSSFSKARNFWNKTTQKNETFSLEGRFDPVLAPRFIPVAEAAIAMVILDQLYHSLGEKNIMDFISKN